MVATMGKGSGPRKDPKGEQKGKFDANWSGIKHSPKCKKCGLRACVCKEGKQG